MSGLNEDSARATVARRRKRMVSSADAASSAVGPALTALRMYAVCLALFLEGMSSSSINVQVAAVRADLGTGPVELQLVATAFLIAYAGLLPIAGQLVDRFDRRQLFLAGLALFGVGSMACAVGIAPWLVITGRFVQGAGAALSAPAALAIITGPLGAGQARNRAVAIYGAMGAVGFSTGLVVPGLLVAYAGWQASFAILVPVVALVMVATWRAPSAPSTVTGRLDGWSAGCLTLVIALGMFLVGSLAEPHPAMILALVAVLTVLVWVLVVRGGVAGLPSEVLRERRVIAAALALAGVFAAVLSSMYVLTLALQDWRGFDGFEVGLLILPQPLLFALLAARGARLVTRYGSARPVALGIVTIVASVSGVGLVGLDRGVLPVVVAMAGVGIGMALVFPAASIVAVNATPAALRGTTAAVLTTAQNVGGALGLAVVTAFALVPAPGHDGDLFLGMAVPVALLVAAGLAAVTVARK